MKYIMFYNDFDAVVGSYDEGYELLIDRYGCFDGHEVFFEEYSEEED